MPIREFFENDELNILTAVYLNGRITFQHDIPQESEISLIFYKIPKSNYQPLNQKHQQNIIENGSANNTSSSKHPYDTQIGLLTLEGGMVKSIYNSVTRVFSAQSSKVISFVCSRVSILYVSKQIYIVIGYIVM